MIDEKEKTTVLHLLAQMENSRLKQIATIVYPILRQKSMIPKKNLRKVLKNSIGGCSG